VAEWISGSPSFKEFVSKPVVANYKFGWKPGLRYIPHSSEHSATFLYVRYIPHSSEYSATFLYVRYIPHSSEHSATFLCNLYIPHTSEHSIIWICRWLSEFREDQASRNLYRSPSYWFALSNFQSSFIYSLLFSTFSFLNVIESQRHFFSKAIQKV
jgi:hypothetical protein